MTENPYESSFVSASTDGPSALDVNTSSRPSWRFISLNLLCLLAIIGLGLHASLLLCVTILETFGEFMFPGFVDPNKPLEPGLETTISFTQLGTFVLSVPVYIFNIVVVCMFMYRANVNVRSLGATGLKNTPAWCGGYWFVPIANLFMPYQCMNEIYKASTNPDGVKWKTASSHWLMGAWWACWILGGIASRVETRLAIGGTNLGAGGLILSWAIVLTIVAAALMLIAILRSITKLQSN